MSKRKALDPWDPIEAEARILERERYLQQLFVPVIPELARRPTRWLVHDLIPEGYLCLLAAEPKEGKTSLATAIALAVATGSPFAGRNTEQGAVLWLSAEESMRERGILLDQSPLVDASLPLYTCYQRLPIDDENSLDALGYWVTDREAKLVVVDPLLAATSGRSLHDGWNARRSLQALKRFCDQRRVAALVLHHRKDARHGLARSRAAENDQLSATASLVMSMKVRKLNDPLALDASIASERERGQGVRVCEAVSDCDARRSTLNASPNPPRLIALELSGRGEFANQTLWLLSDGPLTYIPVDGTVAEPPPLTVGESELRVLEAILARPKHSVQLMQEIEILRPGTTRNVLTRLRRKGLVEVRLWKSGIRHYALTPRGRTYVLEMQKLRENPSENDESDELDSK